MSEPRHEIVVLGARADDMRAISRKLEQACIRGDNLDGIGNYLRALSPTSVFVWPLNLAESVRIINALGFSTDEDDNTDLEGEIKRWLLYQPAEIDFKSGSLKHVAMRIRMLDPEDAELLIGRLALADRHLEKAKDDLALAKFRKKY